MFILLEGRTKDQAFKIGQEIADAVTRDNPKPIKLKFEKVVTLLSLMVMLQQGFSILS
jgi:DNA polymerase zeta